MERKHTPGPWIVKRSGMGYPYQIVALNESDKKPGAVGKAITRWAAITLPSSDEGKANARLIAAAPHLLAFAEWTESLLTGAENVGLHLDIDKQHIRAQARAVIAKATGGA